MRIQGTRWRNSWEATIPSFSPDLRLAVLPWDLAFGLLVPDHRISISAAPRDEPLAPRIASPPRYSINSLVTVLQRLDREMAACASAAFIRCSGYLTLTRDRQISHWNLYHLLPMERPITSDISFGPVARHEDALLDAAAHRNCSGRLIPVKWLSSDFVQSHDVLSMFSEQS